VRLTHVSRRAGTDPEGVVQFCRAMNPRLVGALALHCGDAGIAEELTQETLARVWERWPAVREMPAPEAWTFRVAFNLTASRFRRVAAERRARARLHAEEVPASPREADAADVVAVREAVAALPDRQRAAIVLRYFADLSVEATANALGCRPGTVKSLTSQAIARLRERFELSPIEEDAQHV
jgi:RNA polymerase sigma-70 factor (sigma-E family)